MCKPLFINEFIKQYSCSEKQKTFWFLDKLHLLQNLKKKKINKDGKINKIHKSIKVKTYQQLETKHGLPLGNMRINLHLHIWVCKTACQKARTIQELKVQRIFRKYWQIYMPTKSYLLSCCYMMV